MSRSSKPSSLTSPAPATGCPAQSPAASPVYVPCLPGGWQYSAGLLLLTPGADNLGYATITTFLPLQNPQWDVQALDPNAQPGLMVGARYNLASPGKDIQTSWEHLRAGAATSLGALIVGPGMPFTASEVAKTLQMPAVASLEWDPTSAEVFSVGNQPRRKFENAGLSKSLRAAVQAIQSTLSSSRAAIDLAVGERSQS